MPITDYTVLLTITVWYGSTESLTKVGPFMKISPFLVQMQLEEKLLNLSEAITIL